MINDNHINEDHGLRIIRASDVKMKQKLYATNKLSLEDYHKLPPKSAHFLMDVALKNCSKAVRNQEHPKKPTKAMVNGTLIHTAIETKYEF